MFPIISPIVFAIVVVVLGYVTPGYNHLNHTISRLAIEKYGWIQSVNFFQLALAFSVLGTKLSSEIKTSSSRMALRVIFSLTSFFLVVAGLVPTDRIENIPLNLSIYTPLGLIHVGAVLLIIAASPIGIHRLAKILAEEPKYKPYSHITKLLGYTLFIACVIWIICFIRGLGFEYRGITQKIIILAVLIWVTVMSAVSRKR